MPVTLKQIAEQANCSVMTVSNVLNNKGDMYRPEMRRRVLEATKRLGYRPNAAARATRAGRCGNVTLLSSVHDEQSNLPTGLLGGLQESLAQHDLRLSFARLPDEKLTDPQYMMKLLRLWSADGILVNYTHGYPLRMIELIEQYRLPAIWLNCRLEYDCVFPDDVAAGRLAAEHLIGKGLNRIAFVDYAAGWKDLDQMHYSLKDRQEGYEQAMRDAGLEPWVVREDYHVSGSDRLAVSQRWLEDCDPPQGVVAYSGAQSVELAMAVRGRQLGRDYDMVVFADRRITMASGPVATVVIPQWRLGEQGTAALLQKIESQQARLAPVTIQPELALPDPEDEGRQKEKDPSRPS